MDDIVNTIQMSCMILKRHFQMDDIVNVHKIIKGHCTVLKSGQSFG